MKSHVVRDDIATVRAAIEDARRVLRLWDEVEPSEARFTLENLADESMGFLTMVESMEEIRLSTWRPLYQEGDQIVFCNDWGETAQLPTRVAVTLAKGQNLGVRTRVEDGVIEFELGGRQSTRAPLSLVRGLTPRRWPEQDSRSGD